MKGKANRGFEVFWSFLDGILRFMVIFGAFLIWAFFLALPALLYSLTRD